MKKIGQDKKTFKTVQNQLRGVKPFVATPAYDGKVDVDYAISLADSVMVAAAMGVGVQAAAMGNGAFIDVARNNYVRLFLESDCSHLFFIDADLKWESRAFIGLLSSGLPVTAGMYRRRQEPEEYPVKYRENEEGGLKTVNGGWVECERVPTGFLCIERRVIEEMAADAPLIEQYNSPDIPELFYTNNRYPSSKEVEGRKIYKYMGEDFSWCDDYCKRYNTFIHVWPDFDFVHGGYKCNWHEFMNKKVEDYDRSKNMKIVV